MLEQNSWDVATTTAFNKWLVAEASGGLDMLSAAEEWVGKEKTDEEELVDEVGKLTI
jgi:hypothetical protein